jgi:hypothetical protein
MTFPGTGAITVRRARALIFGVTGLLAIFLSAPRGCADEPYARSRDYDLQHSKIALRFDLEHKKVLGDVIHSIFIPSDSPFRALPSTRGQRNSNPRPTN